MKSFLAIYFVEFTPLRILFLINNNRNVLLLLWCVRFLNLLFWWGWMWLLLVFFFIYLMCCCIGWHLSKEYTDLFSPIKTNISQQVPTLSLFQYSSEWSSMSVHWNTRTSVTAAPSLPSPSHRRSRPWQWTWSWSWAERPVQSWNWASAIRLSSRFPSRNSWEKAVVVKGSSCGEAVCSQAPVPPESSTRFPHKLTGTTQRCLFHCLQLPTFSICF